MPRRSAAADDSFEDELESLPYARLRELCKEAGLPASGKKVQLIEALIAHRAVQAQEDQQAGEGEGEREEDEAAGEEEEDPIKQQLGEMSVDEIVEILEARAEEMSGSQEELVDRLTAILAPELERQLELEAQGGVGAEEGEDGAEEVMVDAGMQERLVRYRAGQLKAQYDGWTRQQLYKELKEQLNSVHYGTKAKLVAQLTTLQAEKEVQNVVQAATFSAKDAQTVRAWMVDLEASEAAAAADEEEQQQEVQTADPAMYANLTLADMHKMRVTQLRQALVSLGLPSEGNRLKMMERLIEDRQTRASLVAAAQESPARVALQQRIVEIRLRELRGEPAAREMSVAGSRTQLEQRLFEVLSKQSKTSSPLEPYKEHLQRLFKDKDELAGILFKLCSWPPERVHTLFIIDDDEVTRDAVRNAIEAATAGASGAGTGAAPADSPYIGMLKRLPAPSNLAGDSWPDFQDRVEDNFQDNCAIAPMFRFLRPHTAVGLAAVLAYRGFGEFLRLTREVDLDGFHCQITLELIEQMSRSYMNTTTKAALEGTQKFFGTGHKGFSRGAEAQRAQELRGMLRKLFERHAHKAPSLEPSLSTTAETDGSWRVKNADGSVMSEILIIEVMEDTGQGGANPMVKMTAYYAKLLAGKAHLPMVQFSCFPALGLEVIGSTFRVHALFYTGRINCQPLTPLLHLSDLRFAVPGYTEGLVRVFKALAMSLVALEELYLGDLSQLTDTPEARRIGDYVRKEVPYALHGCDDVRKLRGGQLVYLCNAGGPQPFIAKLVPGAAYPTELHQAAAAAGLVPKLIALPEVVPGDFQLIKTEYLDPRDGWVPLEDYNDDMERVSAAALLALARLHDELGAVHGDLRSLNIFARAVGDQVEVRFIDLDWAGYEGVAKYPPFINQRIDWGLPDPVGKLIGREHDADVLSKSLIALRHAQTRRGLPRAGGGAT